MDYLTVSVLLSDEEAGILMPVSDFELDCDPHRPGHQTVTVRWNGLSTSFQIYIYPQDSVALPITIPSKADTYYIALYASGRMVGLYAPLIRDSLATAYVSSDHYEQMSYAQLFMLNEEHTPVYSTRYYWK